MGGTWARFDQVECHLLEFRQSQLLARTYPFSHVRRLTAPAGGAYAPARLRCAGDPSGPDRHPDGIADHQAERLKAILGRCPELAKIADHVRTFAELMTRRHGDQLEEWMSKVRADDLPDLRSFVAGLRRDARAVTNGLTLPYSPGPVEGAVNRIKMLKWQRGFVVSGVSAGPRWPSGSTPAPPLRTRPCSASARTPSDTGRSRKAA
ncbi:transposase [Streptomyces sp. SRF1]|uniref:transposase n=1 Tax=Streptomyces sp. SRF1 TaxID=1549642 RepID=UPI00339D3438